ncbi:anti-sigma factor domain-containing protein [Saccharothrix sp. Mg75]|uniref:anti-sigma factor n=1 Tax=Saccharothrix sp. Mg75 TaxID=3445357 RepID=UPI003EEC09A9
MTGEQRDDWCPQEELAVGFAVHALEPDEEAQLYAHLPTCERCRQTVRATEEVTAALGSSVRQYDPPDRLRARLMAAVDETPQEHVRRPAPEPAPEPAPLAAPIPLEPRRRRAGGWGRRALVAAAVVVAVAGIGVAGVRINQLGDQVAAQDARAERLERVLDLAANPAANRAVLRSASGEEVAVLVSTEDSAAVVPVRLTSNDAAHQVYVVWGASTQDPVALATFDVGADASDAQVLTWSPDAHKHLVFALSLEQGRSMPQAPSGVLASGQVGSA